MTDRIPCINPRCRRTSKRQADEPEGTEICCGKCWRLLPVKLTQRYRALKARDRHIGRLAKRKRTGIFNTAYQLEKMSGQLDRLCRANWSAIRSFFHPTERPAGLDSFLEEMNL